MIERWIKKRKNVSLADEIKRAIALRILFSFLILLFAVFFIGALNISSTFTQLQRNVKEQCALLSDFTISQILIDNEAAVQLNLDAVNKRNKQLNFEWIKQTAPVEVNKIIWTFPMSWVDYCPIRSKDNSLFGYYKVSGSLLYNDEMLSEFLMKMALIIGLVLVIFLLLYPLGKRIPERIFIQPVMGLMNLLKSGQKKDKRNTVIEDDEALPIELREIKNKLIQLLKDAEEYSHDRAFAQIAEKVAHDIRSPLAALNMILKKNKAALKGSERQIIQSATQRINDIANNLLHQKKEKNLLENVDTKKPEMAAILLDSILSEKRAQYADQNIQLTCHVDEDLLGVFIQVNAENFFRVLSNLVNNAVEAIKEEGEVHVTLTRSADKPRQILFSVIDTGMGMSQEQLETVLKHNVSIGKEKGTGIGLSSSIKSVESWHGVFSMTSELHKGTQVNFTIPMTENPSWFADHLWLTEKSSIIILDDDETIHQMWKEHFKSLKKRFKQLTFLNFYDTHTFSTYFKEHDIQPDTLFLCDYEIVGSSHNGLDVIKTLQIERKALLVTSHYYEENLQNECIKQGIRLCAKAFAIHMKLNVINANPDFIFIDDSVYLTDAWKMQAELSNKKLMIFNHVNDILQTIHYFQKETPIYIDSNLDHVMKGEELAKILYDQGFTTLYLCTGMDSLDFPAMPWIKAIIGKEYPQEFS